MNFPILNDQCLGPGVPILEEEGDQDSKVWHNNHDFLQPMSMAVLAPWTGMIILVGDIVVYVMLCALMT